MLFDTNCGSNQQPLIWYEVTDPSTDRVFYGNPTTGQCSWSKPPGKIMYSNKSFLHLSFLELMIFPHGGNFGMLKGREFSLSIIERTKQFGFFQLISRFIPFQYHQVMTKKYVMPWLPGTQN